MFPKPPRPLAAVAAIAVAAALAAAGCGGGSGGGGSSSSSSSSSGSVPPPAKAPKAIPQVAALVPASLKSKGTLTVAMDATYAPNEFIAPDGKTIVGMDVDLARAVAGVMGLKANVVNATFDSIIPGLAAHKYDVGMSSFTDTKARQKTVDFVTYFSAGTAFYEKSSGGPHITGLSSLCGDKVAVEKGTTQANDALAQGKKCTAAGKPTVTVSVFPDQNGANLALSSGRAQVVMADSPVAAYAVKQSGGQFKLVGQQYGTAPYGIAMPKGSGLDTAMLAAVKAIMATGTYRSILQKWGEQSGAIANPKINGATS